MSSGKDEGKNQGHGLDDLEPLEEHSDERQEPEDDYYIKNYVLKEAQDLGEARAEEGADVATESTVVVVEEEAGAVEDKPADAGGPPAFGSQMFSPSAEDRAEEPKAEPEIDTSGLSRAELLTGTLSDLLESSIDIEAAVLVSMDGLAMASALPDTMEEDRVAAMSAAILGLGERASAELGRGSLNQVFVEGADGYVFLMSAGGKAVLTALAGKSVKVGLVFYDMRHAAAKIAEVL